MDRVLKIDDKEINSGDDLRTTVRAMKAGKEVKMKVLRNGKEEEIKIVLEKMPAQANLPMIQEFNYGSMKPDKVRFYNSPLRSVDTTGTDSVTLRDGNRLDGTIKSINATDLVLKLESGPDVPLMMNEVVSAKVFGDNKKSKLPVGVLLRNGGWFTGEKLSMEGNIISLIMEGGTPLSLEQSQVAEVLLHADATPILYRGPNESDGWKATPAGSWKFEENAWVHTEAQGSVSKKFTDLPAAMELSFEVPAASANFAHVTLYSYRGEADVGLVSSPGAIQIQLNGGSPNIMQFDGFRYHTLQPLEALGDFKLDQSKPFSVSIYSDRTKGLLSIRANGHSLGTYETAKVLNEDLPRAGRVIQFSGQNRVSVSQISLRPWIGNIPESTIISPGEDRIFQSGGKEQLGHVEKITDNTIMLSKGATIPCNKPTRIQFEETLPPLKTAPGGIWVETNNGTAFAANSLTVDQGTVLAKASIGKDISLGLPSLRTLDFKRVMEAPVPSSRIPRMDVMTFNNGRQLMGTFTPPIADGKVRWKFSAAKEPLEFPSSNVSTLFLAPKGEPIAAGNHVIRLRSGDWLEGELLSVDDQFLNLKTAFAESLQLRRSDVQSVYTTPASGVVSDTATGRKRWREMSGRNQYSRFNLPAKEDTEPNSPNYTYQDGAYQLKRSRLDSMGNEGIYLPVPETSGAFAVEFNLSTVQSWLTFQLMDKSNNPLYSLFCSGNRVQMNSMRANVAVNGIRMQGGGDQYSFTLPGKMMLTDKTTRVRIVFDSNNRNIHLAFNGVHVGTCKIKKDDTWPEVGSLLFTPPGNGAAEFKVSDVWIAPWRGNPEQAQSADKNLVWLALANGDEAAGKLVKLDGKTLEVDTPDVGALTLPVTRIRSLEFNPPITQTPPAYRVRLYDRGRISASAITVLDQSVKLASEIGEITLPLNQVKEIVFLGKGR